MFTGIITAVGTVERANRSSAALELTIGSAFTDLEPGESIAVDGVCLTVESTRGAAFSAQVVPTTLARTCLAGYSTGRRVNLERALRASDRLGGHLVQGHVDGVGQVVQVVAREDGKLLDISVPDEVGRVSVPLGSIAVDGVSLTVNAIPNSGVVQVSLIPFTLQHTTLSERKPGDRVHLEADAIGKYVWSFLEKREGR